MILEDLKILNRYIDGELEGSQLTAFEQRLRSEPRLRKYLEELRALQRESNELEVFKAPDVYPFSRGRFHIRPINQRIAAFLAGAAVAAVCILAVIGPGSSPASFWPISEDQSNA